MMVFMPLSKDDRGNAAVEFAFILPALLMLILGVFQGGILLWTQSALYYSVQTAARCASNNTSTCGTSSQIKSYAAAASGSNFTASVFTVSTPSCGNQVTASYPANVVFPFTSAITLTAQSCFPLAQ